MQGISSSEESYCVLGRESLGAGNVFFRAQDRASTAICGFPCYVFTAVRTGYLLSACLSRGIEHEAQLDYAREIRVEDVLSNDFSSEKLPDRFRQRL